MTTPANPTPAKKYPWAEIGDAVICKYMKPGIHEVYFERQDFDKRQWWLVVEEKGKRVRLTSINRTQWNKFDWETRLEIIRNEVNKII